MRLIKSNNIEPEYPKRHICDECGAELEYDKEDVHIGWMGYEYVTCPACGREIVVSDQRVQLKAYVLISGSPVSFILRGRVIFLS